MEELDGCVITESGDRIIPAKHFGLCPFDALTAEGFGTDTWSLSSGGDGLENGTRTISIFHRGAGGEVLDSLTQDRWVIPEGIAHLLDLHYKWGDKDRLTKIRAALDPA